MINIFIILFVQVIISAKLQWMHMYYSIINAVKLWEHHI